VLWTAGIIIVHFELTWLKCVICGVHRWINEAASCAMVDGAAWEQF